MSAAPVLHTVGHGTAGEDELVALLRRVGVRSLIDIRTAPGSRRHPHVARARMAEWLPAAGIGYRWERRLGGFRRLPDDSPDVIWRNESFRAYAAHTRTEEFVAAVDDVLSGAADTPTAVMCSEAVWWRCHRRIVADFVTVAREVEVRHVFHDGHVQTHVPTEGVRLGDDGLLVYDGGQERLR